MDRTDSLMRLEIIEGFTAMHAAVQGFAGGRAEMTDRASVVRSAQRARHHHIARAPGNTRNVDDFFPGWRNTVALQGLARSEERPVGKGGVSPCRSPGPHHHSTTH